MDNGTTPIFIPNTTTPPTQQQQPLWHKSLQRLLGRELSTDERQLVQCLSPLGIAKINTDQSRGINIKVTIRELQTSFVEVRDCCEVARVGLPDAVQRLAMSLQRRVTIDDILYLSQTVSSAVEVAIAKRVIAGDSVEDAIETLASEYRFQQMSSVLFTAIGDSVASKRRPSVKYWSPVKKATISILAAKAKAKLNFETTSSTASAGGASSMPVIADRMSPPLLPLHSVSLRKSGNRFNMTLKPNVFWFGDSAATLLPNGGDVTAVLAPPVSSSLKSALKASRSVQQPQPQPLASDTAGAAAAPEGPTSGPELPPKKKVTFSGATPQLIPAKLFLIPPELAVPIASPTSGTAPVRPDDAYPRSPSLNAITNAYPLSPTASISLKSETGSHSFTKPSQRGGLKPRLVQMLHKVHKALLCAA